MWKLLRQKQLELSYKLLTIFLQMSFINFVLTFDDLHINLLQPCYKLVIDFLQTSYDLLTNLFTNILQNSYKVLFKILQTSYDQLTVFL
jgi:hypothetical protein